MGWAVILAFLIERRAVRRSACAFSTSGRVHRMCSSSMGPPAVLVGCHVEYRIGSHSNTTPGLSPAARARYRRKRELPGGTLDLPQAVFSPPRGLGEEAPGSLDVGFSGSKSMRDAHELNRVETVLDG